MDRLKMSWKFDFWGPFLHLRPPYSQVPSIMMARNTKMALLLKLQFVRFLAFRVPKPSCSSPPPAPRVTQPGPEGSTNFRSVATFGPKLCRLEWEFCSRNSKQFGNSNSDKIPKSTQTCNCCNFSNSLVSLNKSTGSAVRTRTWQRSQHSTNSFWISEEGKAL